MPKMKTHSGTAKRIKKTGTGKFKRKQAFHRHLASNKLTSRKRRLRKAALVCKENEKELRRLLPYA